MDMDNAYRPWLMADKQNMRPLLAHVLVERTEGGHGVLVAADGFAMLVLPVTLTEEDVPGLLRGELLKWAWSKWGDGPTVVLLDADEATLPDGSRHARIEKDLKGTYPDWRKIVALVPTEDATTPLPPFSPRLLRRLCKALGTDVARIVHGAAGDPMLVRGHAGDGLEPPYGVLMPMLDVRPCEEADRAAYAERDAADAREGGGAE